MFSAPGKRPLRINTNRGKQNLLELSAIEKQCARIETLMMSEPDEEIIPQVKKLKKIFAPNKLELKITQIKSRRQQVEKESAIPLT